MEEIGLKIENRSDIYQGNFIFNSIEWKGYFYFAESVSGKAFIKKPDKIKDLKYIRDAEEINFKPLISVHDNLSRVFFRVRLSMMSYKLGILI